MSYVILSGRFETGTDEQKNDFALLFGEETVNYKFDLYFHWYNLVHELGHCILDMNKIKKSGVREEMYVNELAVAYYIFTGEYERLEKLESIINEALSRMISPVPEGMDFVDYYEDIWGTEKLNDVLIYGYFQLNSVLKALKKQPSLADTLSEIGFTIDTSTEMLTSDFSVIAENSGKCLRMACDNFIRLGVVIPDIHVELQDDPSIQRVEII
ncbi:MAG: hypothetical protein K6G47_10610 [Clostridia bacterium]|nr:hypothetical protein [Clostridia bacterium]